MVVSIQKMMSDFTVEPLPVDMQTKYRDFLAEYGFAPGHEEIFRWYSNLSASMMFVTMDHQRIIASGMAISMGKTGWIGAICTHEDYRGMGLGRLMTERTIDALKEGGAEAILLRASDEGARLYRKMGFRDTGSYENFFVGPGELKDTGFTGIKPLGSLSERHFSLDSGFTGETRGQLIESLSGPGGYELADGDNLQGFIFPSVGDGVVGMVQNPDHIPAMLGKVMSGRGGKIRSIKGAALNTYMREQGFDTNDGALRMCLGDDPIKNKNGIIGTISSSIG